MGIEIAAKLRNRREGKFFFDKSLPVASTAFRNSFPSERWFTFAASEWAQLERARRSHATRSHSGFDLRFAIAGLTTDSKEEKK